MSVFEITLSTARLKDALARKGLTLDSAVTFRLVADPAAGTLSVERSDEPRPHHPSRPIDVATGQYL